MTKVCSNCKLILSVRMFHKHSASKDGLKTACKSCRNAAKKTYRTNNKDKCNNYNSLWQKTNKISSSLASKKWKKNNSHRVNSINSARYAAKLQRTPKWLTVEQLAEIEEFYTITKELQWLSDKTDPLEVDHIVPLQGKNVCGLHVPWNLQVLTKSENSRKRNKFE